MEFRQHYSSSAGNLYELVMNHARVLIDPGVTLSRIRRDGISLSGCGVWRSHDHADHAKGYRDLFERMALPEARPWREYEMQHDVSCRASLWIEPDTGETLMFAIDTGSFKGLPAQPATIYAMECNYQDEYMTQDHTTLRVRQNHASLYQVIAYLERCDLSETREIHLLHISGRHANAFDCARAVRQRFAIPTYTINEAR